MCVCEISSVHSERSFLLFSLMTSWMVVAQLFTTVRHLVRVRHNLRQVQWTAFSCEHPTFATGNSFMHLRMQSIVVGWQAITDTWSFCLNHAAIDHDPEEHPDLFRMNCAAHESEEEDQPTSSGIAWDCPTDRAKDINRYVQTFFYRSQMAKTCTHRTLTNDTPTFPPVFFSPVL